MGIFFFFFFIKVVGKMQNFTLIFYGKNIILVPAFWSHNQFGPYILVAINLIPVIFKFTVNLVSIVNFLTRNVYMANRLCGQ